jgi:predicted peptidase
MQKILTTILYLLIMQTASTQYQQLYEKKEFIKGNDTLRYRILYPLDYKATKKYPLIVLMHGSGERGNNNEDQLKHGSYLFADSVNRKKFPAIVIFPQCGRDDFWARVKRSPNKNDSLGGLQFASEQPMGKGLNLVSELLDSLVAAKKVNAKKIYIGGLSMGGMATFELLWRKPGFFAAAFPICGGGDPEKVKQYGKKFPIWVFHGDNDQSVPVANSRLMVNALKASGARVKYTEYPGVGHNSWDNAFADPELLPWLFKQKK